MKSMNATVHAQIQRGILSTLSTFAAVVFMVAPAMAAGFAGADQKVCGFFDNINGLLNLASIAVVTVAIIFAGYQIAFAHKRISDVAPILIGGLLIGAASQVAKMLIGDTGEQCTAMLVETALRFHA
jgi:type IV secretion system protein VirB2